MPQRHGSKLTRTGVVAIIIAAPADRRALVVVLPVLAFLQAHHEREPAERSSHAGAFSNAALLLAANAAGARGPVLAVPASACCAACAVAVLFDVGLFVGVFPVLADAEDGEHGVEECARAAEEAEQEEQQYADDDADDDTRNGTARQASAASSDLLGVALSAGGDGGFEGPGDGWTAGVCDYDEA